LEREIAGRRGGHSSMRGDRNHRQEPATGGRR